jgi:PIN domain nuclease of toxin-antitoxin system
LEREELFLSPMAALQMECLFDRLISAQAILEGQRLLTKDRTLLEHCSLAFW